jgi:hypothetical protein
MTESLLVSLGEWTLRATALAAVAGAVLWSLRIRDVSVRLGAWTIVVFGSLLIPLVTLISPRLPVPMPKLPGSVKPPSRLEFVTAPAANEANSLEPELPPRNRRVVSIPEPPRGQRLGWPAAAVGVWLTVAMLMLLRVIAGLWLSRKLVRQSGVVQDGIHESANVTVPVTVGLVRPVTMLPLDWREWDQWRFEAVVVHERAHAARRDPIRQVAVSVYRSLFWFHPLAWWLPRHVAELAEAASDDAALRILEDRARYAEALLDFFGRTPGRVAWQGVAMARGGRAARRLERVLDSQRKLASFLTRRVASGILSIAAPVVFLAASTRPVWTAAPQVESSQSAAIDSVTPDSVPQTAAPLATGAQSDSASGGPTVSDRQEGIIGKTLTLSQRGILALDHRAGWRSTTILKAAPSGNGVEYTIWFSTSTAQVYLESTTEGGKGSLVGLPLSTADTFALQFTLLSSTPGPDAFVSAGAVVNLQRSSSAYAPVLLGGTGASTAVSRTRTDASRTAVLGFTVGIAPAYAGSWPTSGGLIRLLVEPAPDATLLEPASIDTAVERGYRDRVIGETLTLSQQGILALDHKSWQSASLMSATPSGKGVEYTIRFDQVPASLRLDSSADGGAGALVGLPLSGLDSFALRFTLLSSTPGPAAYVSAGAVVNQQKSRTSHTPVRLGGTRGSTAVAGTGTDASVTKVLGFIVYVAPYDAGAWPASGGVVQLLIEPAPDATPIGDDPSRTKINQP